MTTAKATCPMCCREQVVMSSAGKPVPRQRCRRCSAFLDAAVIQAAVAPVADDAVKRKAFFLALLQATKWEEVPESVVEAIASLLMEAMHDE